MRGQPRKFGGIFGGIKCSLVADTVKNTVNSEIFMALTFAQIKAAKSSDKPMKLSDEHGMYLFVNQSGKYWRFDYRFGGKRKTMSIGVFPAVGLAQARQALYEARALLSKGMDPMKQNGSAEAVMEEKSRNDFESVARDWIKNMEETWASEHESRVRRSLENWVFPWIGAKIASEIHAADLLSVARRIEEAGRLETAHRVVSVCGQVFRYAMACGKAYRDPSQDLRGALKPYRSKPRAAVTSKARLAEVLCAIDGYAGNFQTRLALRLLPLVFVRPKELRLMEWAEVDLDAGLWSIPGPKMKMRLPHVVPLARQAIRILQEIKPLSGSSGDVRFVFPGVRDKGQPLSNMTLNAALQRLGFDTQDEITSHGFRTVASTFLHELGFPSDAIELQLAHRIGGVRGVYMRSQYLDQRKAMMQAWADFLDSIKSDNRAAV